MSDLGIEELRAIQSAIESLDPDGSLVRLDVETQQVWYSDDFVLHKSITSYIGEEEPTRAYIVTWLCAVAGYLPSNIELEKGYSIGRPKVGAQLDVLVRQPDGTPYCLIECKAPSEYEVDADKFIEGQLFNVAPHETGCRVLSYTTVEVSSDTVSIRAISIDYLDTPSYSEWRDNGRPAASEIPLNYGEPRHVHYRNDSERDLEVSVDQRQLDKIRVRLHNVLWRGSTPDNVIYGYVVRLFLAKIYDEKTTSRGEQYRFQIVYNGNRREDPSETFARINALYLEAYDRYLNPTGIAHTEALNDREFSHEQTAFVVQLLQGISLSMSAARNGDVLGGFFEAITREGFKQSKGLFFTHVNVAAFILKCLDIEQLAAERIKAPAVYSERLPYIIDPACGSGTFLLVAMKLITEHVSDHRAQLSRSSDARDFLDEKFPEGHPNLWAKDFLFGIESHETVALATKVNMVLRRDGNTHVYNADGLSDLDTYQAHRLKGSSPNPSSNYSRPVSNGFDVVVTNPPFSITLDPDTSRQLGGSFELAEEKNSENLFLERWYQLLKPGGRLGAVLPESFYATMENFSARLFLFAHFHVKAVVSLPRHAFEPWTPTRTSLLFASKKTPEEEKQWADWFESSKRMAADTLRNATQTARRYERIVERLSEALRRFGADAVGEFKPDQPLAEAAEWVASIREAIPAGDVTLEESEKRSSVLAGLTRLRNELAELADIAGEVKEAADRFGLEIPEIGSSSSLAEAARDIPEIAAGLSSVDADFYAFTQAAEASESGDEILLISVDDIGYKRTKRSEQEKPNSLFRAIESNDGGSEVYNLNLASGTWKILEKEGAEDALSVIKEHDLWT